MTLYYANADKTIKPEDLKDSLINNVDECSAFSLTAAQTENNPGKVLGFMVAARDRTLRIYSEWFDALAVEKLIQPCNFLKE